MIHRFSNDSWFRREESMHSPELKAWISQVLRDAARRPDGVAELRPTVPPRGKPPARVFRETDNEAECRTLAGHGTIFVPKCYEEKYAYPLIVWLNDSIRQRPTFQDFLMGLSDRNYLGFAPDEATSKEIIEAAESESRERTESEPRERTVSERQRAHRRCCGREERSLVRDRCLCALGSIAHLLETRP